MSALSLAKLAQGLAARYPARYGLTLGLEELRVRVRSNSAAVVGDLRGYFKAFVVADTGPADLEILALDGPVEEPPVALAARPPAPGKRPDKERFVDVQGTAPGAGPGGGRLVRKQATGMLFLFGQGWNIAVNIAVGPCAANRNQLVNFLCARYMERRLAAGWMLGHAAGVVRPAPDGDKALALCGFAGMGKSTLALHLLTRGLDFLSNDRVLVEPAGPGRGPVLHGIPKHPRLNPGTALGNPALVPYLAGALPEAARRAYAGLTPEALRAVEDKFDAPIDSCFGPPAGSSRFRLAAPLSGVVVLNWKHGGGPLITRRVDLEERRDLLQALRREPGVFYLPQALGAGARLTPEQCLEAVHGVPALELTGGADFEAGAAACEEFLGG